MLGGGTSHHYRRGPRDHAPGTTHPARTPSPHPQTNHNPQTNHATRTRAREPTPKPTPPRPTRHHAQPFKRPAHSTTTPRPNDHAPRPRDRTTGRESRSLPLFLASRAGRLNGGLDDGLEHGRGDRVLTVAHGSTTPRMRARAGGRAWPRTGHAATHGQLSTGRGSTRSCAPCELGHALASLAMRGRSCGLAARGSGPRPGGSSARGATPATPSATGTHARA
jgi:hypothetical protein